MSVSAHSTPRNHPGAELDQHLTIAEAANLISASPSTIRRMISRGELRAYRFGKRLIRIDPADLAAIRNQIAAGTYELVSGGDAR